MKKKLSFSGLVLGITLLISSCSTNSPNASEGKIASNAKPMETIQVTESPITQSPEVKLPTNYTIAKIKDALDTFINYQLWLLPEKVVGNYEKRKFDPHIGKTIDVEVRLYPDNPVEKQVFVHTSIGEWLIDVKEKNGTVYSESQFSENQLFWPQGDYSVVDTFPVQVPEPHKPNYGTSLRKDKMIAAAAAYLKSSCDENDPDATNDDWTRAEIYIGDFFEFEEIVPVFYIREDGGYSWYSGLGYTDESDRAFGTKGVSVDNIDSLDKYDRERYYIETEIHNAIKHFPCIRKGAW